VWEIGSSRVAALPDVMPASDPGGYGLVYGDGDVIEATFHKEEGVLNIHRKIESGVTYGMEWSDLRRLNRSEFEAQIPELEWLDQSSR